MLGVYISKDRNMFVAEFYPFFSRYIWKLYNTYPDGGTGKTQEFNLLYLKHILFSPLEKKMIERMMQYFR
jgi:hypothetical protein